MREIPHSPVALYEVAHPFGTLIAETILASVHMRARKQAGHTGASDLIKALQNTLRGGGRPHTANIGLNVFGTLCDLMRLGSPICTFVTPESAGTAGPSATSANR